MLQVDPAQVNGCSADSSQVLTLVEVGGFYRGPLHAQLVYVKLGGVKPSKIVDHPHHKLQRKVGLQVQTLVALHRKGSRVPLGKGIACKTLNLHPYRSRLGILPPQPLAVVKVGSLHPLKLILGAGFATHAPAQHIRLSQAQPCKMVCYLDHILLVHHDAIGLGHDLRQHRMGLLPAFWVPMPQDVFPHHARSSHPRADDGAGSHKLQVGVGLQLSQQHTHGRRFYVKGANGMSTAEKFLDLGILLKLSHCSDIHFNSLVTVDQLQAGLDVPQPPLAEQIKLV